jgi:serine/threonine-protein kinase
VVGRYALCGEIAFGGMATVHHGLLRGESGFSRTVAIKRLHPHYAKDAELSAMLRDEARFTARVRNPHVVPTLDVVSAGDELLLVMEYVHGEALSRLLRAALAGEGSVPRDIVASVIAGALHGLHAAHEATGDDGVPLEIVHRDATPHNIIVGADGITRVLDFGIAKAAARSQTTKNGELKGKLPYMAPEQLTRKPVDRRTDVYTMGVVLWEALTLQRLFQADNEGSIVAMVVANEIEPPSYHGPDVPPQLDAIVLRALAGDPARRFPTARDMALAIEAAVPVATATKVAAWVDALVGATLTRRARELSAAEQSLASGSVPIISDVPGPPVSVSIPVSEVVMPTETMRAVVAPPRRRRAWVGALAVAVGVSAAGIALTATRGVSSRSTAPLPPSAAPSSPSTSATVATEAPPPSLELSGEVPRPPPTMTAADRATPGRAPRPKSKPTAVSAPPQPPPPNGKQQCEWHIEQGIWVPTNCR